MDCYGIGSTCSFKFSMMGHNSSASELLVSTVFDCEIGEGSFSLIIARGRNSILCLTQLFHAILQDLHLFQLKGVSSYFIKTEAWALFSISLLKGVRRFQHNQVKTTGRSQLCGLKDYCEIIAFGSSRSPITVVDQEESR